MFLNLIRGGLADEIDGDKSKRMKQMPKVNKTFNNTEKQKKMRGKRKVTLLPRTLAGDDENISQTCFWSKTEQPGIIHRNYP